MQVCLGRQPSAQHAKGELRRGHGLRCHTRGAHRCSACLGAWLLKYSGEGTPVACAAALLRRRATECRARGETKRDDCYSTTCDRQRLQLHLRRGARRSGTGWADNVVWRTLLDAAARGAECSFQRFLRACRAPGDEFMHSSAACWAPTMNRQNGMNSNAACQQLYPTAL